MFKLSTQIEKSKKLFLSRFKQVMVSFASSITGIADETIRHNYTSLLLDRLLVLFFLQHRGLLDNNTRYLQHHLDMMHMTQADTFFSAFFLPLCHTGLSTQTTSSHGHRSFGHVPVLAHPLFQKHHIEDAYQPHIPDEPFYKLFLFLAEFRWELIDSTDLAPDMVHHDIFADLLEQRSNQKQTGTYYTTKDVTGYVANNTILPALLHRIEKHYPAIMHPCSTIWQRLMHSPARYIPTALQHPDYLPEETIREYQLRQQRFTGLSTLIRQGTLRTINAIVTHNLDILRLIVDVISTNQDMELLVTLFTELEQLTILDPNCGSGAFLYAALTTLQTLYMTCLQRMQTLLAHREGAFPLPVATDLLIPTTLSTTNTPPSPRVHAILKKMADAPNIGYFVVHHIIAHNLYGVDLMDEATRVCTLRLYLTLLAQTQHVEEVPPLHHVPIHVKTGNALVGDVYSTRGTMISVSTTTGAGPTSWYDSSENIDKKTGQEEGVVQEAGSAQGTTPMACGAFHWHLAFPEVARLGGFAVILGNPPYIEYSKVRYQYAIDGYEEKSCGNLYAAMLERSLALLHPDGSSIGLLLPMSICGGQRFAQLRALLTQSLSPIWLANFDIFPARLFGNAFQRLSILLGSAQDGSGQEAGSAQDGSAQEAGSAQGTTPTDLYTTRIHRWLPEERPFIIDLLRYTSCHQPASHTSLQKLHVFPKFASTLHAEILQKITMRSKGHTIATAQQDHKTPHFIYYQEATNYWIKALCHIPFYRKNGTTMTPPHGRFLFFRDEQTARIIMALMNSSLFYLWFTAYSDGFHLAHSLVTSFPCNQELLEGSCRDGAYPHPLPHMASTLEADLLAHTRLSTRNKEATSLLASGESKSKDRHVIELTEYQVGYSKQIIDEIDRLLTCYYDFTKNELDFIINYDKKYRMRNTERAVGSGP